MRSLTPAVLVRWTSGRLRSALRGARLTQPFNIVMTTVVRLLMRCAGRPWPWAVRHLHRTGSVASVLPNGKRLKLWSRADDWVSNQVFWRGWDGYEPETSPLFFRLAESARVTLDVGAHVGFFSLLAGHANPRARVVAFEPLPPLFARLQANVVRNRLKNVACVRSAVGDKSGQAEFYHVAAGLPCSSSLSVDFMRGTPDLTCSRVDVTTIDGFAVEAGLASVDLVKIDTESTEPAVLLGMCETLRRWRPTIICEVLPDRGTERPLEDILRPLGYLFYHLQPCGPHECARIEGHPEWLNYALVPSRTVLERVLTV
jgi:FkbM family methyltransferase